MTLRLELVPLACFSALMLAAALVDFRRLVIPNLTVVGLCLLWPLHFGGLREATLAGALQSFGCAVIVLAGGSILFARGLIGGGDVKLLAAASLWAGAGAVPRLLVLTALFGGVLALAFLTPFGRWLSQPRAGCERLAATIPGRGQTPIPYGVAIAGAALVVTIPPYLA